MERPTETDGSGTPSEEDPTASGEDDEDEPQRRMVEAGAGADVPVDDPNEVSDDRETPAEPDGGTSRTDEPGDAPGDVGVDPDAGDEEDEVNEDDEGGDADVDVAADAVEDDVPPELRELLDDVRDDRDPSDEEADDSREETEASDSGGTTEPTDTAETGSATAETTRSVEEHRPAEPTDLAPANETPDSIATSDPSEASEPAAEAEPVSVRSEMSPALAERQAFLALILALGGGALLATVGNVLQLSRWQTIMLLVSAGIVVLLIATFVVFRAMLAAAQRNDEPYRTAYTHPLFMFLFIVTTTVTALFVGYVSRLLT
jgi:hypothetical protein